MGHQGRGQNTPSAPSTDYLQRLFRAASSCRCCPGDKDAKDKGGARAPARLAAGANGTGQWPGRAG
jgi:hypothetical protein